MRAPMLAGWNTVFALMKPITALGFLAAGFALAIEPHSKDRLRKFTGWAIASIGLLSLVQNLTGFAPALWDGLAPAGTPAGTGSVDLRMSSATAAGFILAGFAQASPLTSVSRPVLGSLLAMLAMTALLGYAFGTEELYQLPGFGSVSLPTSVCMLLLATGLLTRPDLRLPVVPLKIALSGFVVAALLPAIVFMSVQAYRESIEREAKLEKEGRDLAQRYAGLVEGLIAERSAVLKTLAASPHLQSGDLAAFYNHAKAAVDLDEGVVLVISKSKQILLDTVRPFGTKPADTIDANTVDRAFASGQVEVSDVFSSPFTGKFIVSLVRPVPGRDLAVRITMRDKWLSSQLSRFSPAGWIVAVTDRNGKYITRSRDNDRWIGRFASPVTLTKIRQADSGWIQSINVEDIPIYVSWKTMAFGWTVFAGVEKAKLDALEQNHTKRVSLGLAIISLIALTVAVLAAISMGRPLAQLASAAELLGQGGVPPPFDTHVLEIRNVSTALTRTGEQRTAAESALRESEALLRAATDNAAVGLVLLDRHRRYAFANPAYASILGLPLSANDLIGRGPADVLASIYPTQIGPRLDRVFAGERVSFEFSRVKPDGQLTHYVVVYDPCRDVFETVTGCIVTIFDITDRKIAEELSVRLAAIVQSTSDAIISKTLDGKITSWNEGATGLFGFTSAQMIGQPIRTIIPEHLQSEEDDLIARLAASKRVQAFETVRLHQDGRRVEVSITVSPILDRDGKVTGAAKIARDISERKQVEEQRQRLMSELDHRVMNTLARLRAMIERSRHGAASIDSFAQSLEQRIASMARTHARFSANGWTGGALFELADDELGPYRSGPNVTIDGPEISLRPEAARSISMVLHELATNAAKYGALSVENGHVSLTWRCDGSNQEGAGLHIVWQETGGPTVKPPTRQGFGSLVIINLVCHELAARAEWVPAPEGVRCELWIPLARAKALSQDA